MKYCVGCVSSDEVIALGDRVKRCPVCGKTKLLTEAEFQVWWDGLQRTVEAQLPVPPREESPQ